MGHHAETKCLDCGYTFWESYGGGFTFHLLRCDQCGDSKQIAFDELGELHLQYLKGLDGCYCVATLEYDEYVRKHAPVTSITEEEYHRGISDFAGPCECGGRYTVDGLPRCPKCKSTRLEEGMVGPMYD
ncbi:hypothetical protein SCARR_00121 [Pontiella sulfatireligans]|uniref:Uncharacterized protein n=1 Tax=Pontiella sulfatireligans TaxID=2750658 RepID=A0A6C2UD48_9BACT|nr:hypothetical protein SCARR_00121 [Pontiella sulfatireligans]